MAQQIVIDIGARIQVLQSSIVEVQKVLDRLQPNTSAWRDLSKYIQSMRGELDKLTLQNGKPVVDQKQFTAAEKSLSKIEEVIGKTQLIMSRLKFSDIKLDPNQQKQFDDLQHRMDAAAEKFEAFKQKTTQAFLETGNNKNDLANLFNANILTKDLDTISQKISEKLMAIEVEIDNKTEAIKRLKPGIEIAKALNDSTGENVLSNTFLSTFTDQKFFDKNGNFAAGMRQQFFDMLAETFKLDSTQKNQLAQLSANELRTIFSGEKLGDSKGNKGLSDFISKKTIQTAAGLGTNLDDSIRNLKQQQALLTQLQTGAGASQDDIAAQAEKVAAAEEKLNIEARALQESITSAARSTPEMTNSLSQMNSQLQQTREVLAQTNAQFIQLERVRTSFNAMKMAIVNFMGFRQVLNLVKRGVQEAMTHIKELDSVMNKISIVTDMSTGDLWKQVDAYSKLAQQYGVSIKGAYEVSQIYYQQGLDTKDVMTLTNETLKLSKISGLDYATSTDYMTTAIRGFKMEMEDAGRVVDVYSNLAANTAVSQEELAVAMSKTASSMEGVGATFEEASAMIATVVAVTRESATNIGSAMKSIASRYGELTKNPLKLIDSEGEEMAFNKVDAALQSVGISMKTADGQFRDFTDVIVELSEKWDTLESTQQRYIATQFAGNRQQSRFLALVSNEDLLKKNLEVAEDSEDVGSLQALKALDSIESKLEQVTVAYQQFYTTIGAENVWKNMLGGATSVINTLNGLPKLFGTLPIGAIQVITSIVGLIRNVGTSILTDVANIFVSVIQDSGQAGTQAAQQFTNNFSTGILGGIQKGWHNIKGSFKDAKYAIGIGRDKSAEVQAEETTEQLNIESARQEFERLKTYAKNELGQTIQLQFDASQPQASIEQLKNEIENIRSKSFITVNMTVDKAKQDFDSFYQEYKELAQKNAVQIEFDTSNPLKSIEELRKAIRQLRKDAKELGIEESDVRSLQSRYGHAFMPSQLQQGLPQVSLTNQYKELEAEMNNISGIMTTLEAKSKNLSPREAKVMYAQLTQHIKEASIELEKMKQADPNSEKVKEYAEALEKARTKAAELNTNIQKTKTSTNTLSSAAGALNMIGTLFNDGTAAGYGLSGAIMGIAGALYLVDGISKAIAGSNPFFALAMGAMGVINGISQLMNMQVKEIEIAEKKAEELSNKAKQAKADYKSLDSSKKKIEELTEKRYESAEAAKEYQEAVDDLTSKFPELIGGFDDAGNAILNTSEMEAILTAAREKSAQATYDAAQAELDASKKRLDAKKNQIETDFDRLGTGGIHIRASHNYNEENAKKINSWIQQNYTNGQIADVQADPALFEQAVEFVARQIGEASYIEDYYNTLRDEDADFTLAGYANFLKGKDLSYNKTVQDMYDLINTNYLTQEKLQINSDIEKAIATFNSSQGSDQIIENYNNLMYLLNNLLSTKEGIEQFGKTYNTIYEQLKGLSKDIDAANAENTLYKAYSKQSISAWQNTLQKNTQLFSYLQDSSQLAQFTTNAIQKIVDTEYSGDFTKYKNELEGQTPEIINKANEFWLSLAGQTDENGKELQVVFNEMASDPRYSGKDIVEYFNKYGLGSYEGLQDAIVDSYVNSAIVIKNRILNNISQTSKKTKQPIDFSRLSEFVNNYKKQFTAFDEDYFSLLTKQAYNLKKSGFESKDLVQAGIDLFEMVDGFDTKISAQVLDIILKNGITTKEGLDASLKEIENLDGIKGTDKGSKLESRIKDLYIGLFQNLSLSISSTMDKFLSDWEDIEKEVSKLTSGVSIKEASDIVAKAKNFKDFKLSLSNFKTSGDKLVLSSELTEKYLQAYLKDTTTKIGNYNDSLVNYSDKILSKNKEGKNIAELKKDIKTKQQLKDLGIGEAILGKIQESNGLIANRDEIAKLILKDYENVSGLLDDANLQLAWAKNILKSEKWKAGDYSSLSTQLGEDWSVSFEKALKEGVNKKQKEATPDLKPAVDSAQSAYNSLISDLLSKGFENINLADYEGLYQSDEIQKNLDASKNLSNGYASFISLYSSYLGKTTEEINDLMVQAIQKDTQTTRGAAEVLKKFSFTDENTFTASIDDLKEFANIFGANINDWIASGTATWSSELGAYIVNKANLALPDGTKINVDKIENAMDITVDSINKTLEDLANTIIKGISGKLTKADVTNLNKMLETLGIKNLNLNFQQTSDGLKLAQESAIALYSELKKINAIQAQIVFDDLSKSLQENNENYKNISDIMNHIVQLQENIADADSKGDNTRANQYREELALAKEILAVRSTTEDSSFDFMSNKIPGAQNNPLNYYNSWAKAIKTLYDAQQVTKTVRKGGRKTVEKGFIDYQDWYNIATEMGNIAKLGGPIKVAGITLDGSLEQTAKLIEKGASALTTVDTGEIKVALGGIGLDLTSGANDMTKGVDKGIQAVAKSQIKMLDGMIALLETIVGMEKLGDIAGEDMELTMPDIILSDKDGNPILDSKGRKQYTEQFENWRKAALAEIKEGKTEFAKAAKQIKIGNQSLANIINQQADEWTDDQVKILNALQKAAKSGLWDPNDVAGSMKDVLASAGLGEDADLTIDVGDVHYIIKGGAVIESIDFSSGGAKKAIDRLVKTPQYKNNKQKAKEYIIQQVDAYNKGNPEGIKIDYYTVAEVNNEIKYDKKRKQNYVTFQGKRFYGKDAIKKAMRGKEVAQLLGIKQTEVEFDSKGAASGIKVVQTLDDKSVQFELKISSNGQSTWSATYDGQTFTGNSEEDIYKKIFKQQAKGGETVEMETKEGTPINATYEQWMYLTFGVKVNTATKFFTKDNKPIDDPSKNPELQQAIRDYLGQGKEKLEAEDLGNGMSEITLGNGMKVQLDTDKIKFDGKFNQDAIARELSSILGIDSAMSTAIQQGITGAMPAITGALEGLAGNNEISSGLANVASGLSSILQNAQSLAGVAWDIISRGLSSIAGVNITGSVSEMIPATVPTTTNTISAISTEKGIAEEEKQKAAAEANARLKQQQDAAIKKAEAEAKTAKAETEAAKADAASAREETIAAKAEAATAKEEANNAKTAEASANARADKAEAEAAAAKEEANNAKVAVAKAEEEARTQIAAVKSRADQEIAAAKQQADQEVAKAQADADKRQIAIQNLTQQLQQSDEDNTRLEQEKAQLSQENQKQATELVGLNAQLTEKDVKINSLNSALEQRNEEIAFVNQQLDETSSELNKTRDELTDAQYKLAQYATNDLNMQTVTDMNNLTQQEYNQIFPDMINGGIGNDNLPPVPAADVKNKTETESKENQTDKESQMSVPVSPDNLALALLGQLTGKLGFNELSNFLKEAAGSYLNPEAITERTEFTPTYKVNSDGSLTPYSQPDEIEQTTRALDENTKAVEANEVALTKTAKAESKYETESQKMQKILSDETKTAFDKEAPSKAYLEGLTALQNEQKAQLYNALNSIASTPIEGNYLSTWLSKIWSGEDIESNLYPQIANAVSAALMKVEQANQKITFDADINTDEVDQEISELQNTNPEVNVNVDDNGTANKTAKNIKSSIPSIVQTTVAVTTSNIDSVRNSIKNKLSGIIVGVKAALGKATGNVSLATGNAMAQGTLMGELGPELVVSKGRYFVVGQEGAEFVNLDKDAIVFNHLQTQSLLKNGKAGRGKPQTNERNATSLATGNVGGGPAMASASAALAALRQLRAQWQALAGLGVSDLAQKAGGGGGGGGGGKDKDAAFIRDVERWYNWLQKIAQLEKEITYQEQLRSKIESDRSKDGAAYYRSQKKSLEDTNEQLEITTDLLASQRAYFDKRREELNKSPMSRFYTFDENGQLQYTKNPEGFAELSDLFGRNDEGKPNYTAEEQYNKLVAMGYASYMKYDSSGKEIKPEGKKPDAAYFENAVKAFSERMDSEKEEMQSLHDSIEEYEKSILELETSRNELMQAIIDNQIEVENLVLQAIEDMRQNQIDEAQKDRDAYSESTEKYIDGLNDALSKEQKLYENKEKDKELNKLQRQLAILQRSGGSASQIAGLQKDIESKQQDVYFEKQQEQIDAIKEASDLQIERMDHQIQLMEETLAYEKAHGLLWAQVYDVMNRTPAEINDFIVTNTNSIKEQSAVQAAENISKMEWQIEQWKAYQEDKEKEVNKKNMDRMWNRTTSALKNTYGNVWTEELDEQARKAYEANYDMYADPNMAFSAAQAIFAQKQKEYDAAHYVAPTTTPTSAATTTSKSGSGGGSGRNNNKTSTTSKNTDKVLSGTGKDKLEYIDVTSTLVSGSTKMAKGYTVTYKDSKTKKNKSVNYSAVGNGSLASAKAKAEAYAKKFKGAKVTPYYKYGGLVDYTGLAQVDGTPSRPESFLNASQTAILKKGLLGGKNSLVSVLADFQAMLEGSSHTTVEKNNSSIVIENATVQMNVQHMNNDYDARRAGETALEQIMKVARKAGSQSVSRR